MHLAEAFYFVVFEKTHAGRIDIKLALDAATAGLGHAAPVLERLGDELPRWYGDDSAVEIAHLHRMQRDVDDIAIHAGRGHRDPVAHAQHVVGAELDARDETQDGVLEHQQQHRRHGADARQQQADALVGELGDHQHQRHDPQREVQQLHHALDRALAGRCCAIKRFEGDQRAPQRGDHADDHPAHGKVAHEDADAVTGFEQYVDAVIDDDGRQHARQPAEGAVLVERIVPAPDGVSRGHAHHAVQEQAADEAYQPRREEQAGHQRDTAQLRRFDEALHDRERRLRGHHSGFVPRSMRTPTAFAPRTAPGLESFRRTQETPNSSRTISAQRSARVSTRPKLDDST